jgi:hypothetical protein
MKIVNALDAAVHQIGDGLSAGHHNGKGVRGMLLTTPIRA